MGKYNVDSGMSSYGLFHKDKIASFNPLRTGVHINPVTDILAVILSHLLLWTINMDFC